MNRRIVSAIASSSTAVAAFTVLMTGSAIAESPFAGVDTTPFAGTRSRAEVQAEVMSNRDTLTAAASEWRMQANEPKQLMSGRTRAQATAEYVGSRDQVHALNAEDSGSAYFAQMPQQAGPTQVAGGQATR
ncbi:hypothetical protein [Ramlibacter sp.]|uniref:hypothetical protein n=1 Tax=Ramlibacter sp. TaxID=1917967 RepID=UPI002FC7CA35